MHSVSQGAVGSGDGLCVCVCRYCIDVVWFWIRFSLCSLFCVVVCVCKCDQTWASTGWAVLCCVVLWEGGLPLSTTTTTTPATSDPTLPDVTTRERHGALCALVASLFVSFFVFSLCRLLFFVLIRVCDGVWVWYLFSCLFDHRLND